MTRAAPTLSLVPSPADALLRLTAERAEAAAHLAALDEQIAEACRAFSRERGYCVVLTPHQVKRQIEREANA